MKESSVRQTIKEKLSDVAHVCPIENSVGTGIPDVNISYSSFDYWMELKYREDSPKRSHTPVLKGYLRPQQKVWMKHRLLKGSKNIYVFVRIEDEYYCYYVKDVQSLEDLESLSLDELYTRCCWYGKPRESKQEDWVDMLKIMEHLSYAHLQDHK